MQQRKWSVPAIESSQGRAGDPSEASGRSPRSQWGAIEYVVSFVFYMLFFGLVGALLRSRFPIDLGLFFFFTNDKLIGWVLRTVGIRLVPDSLGATFISAFVWVAGAWTLLVYWKESAPAWLSSLVPSYWSWPLVGAVALGCAVLAAISTAVVGKVLPWFGIEIARDSARWQIVEGLVWFGILGLLALVGSTPMVSDWLGGQ
jgi:hypothetical protein